VNINNQESLDQIYTQIKEEKDPFVKARLIKFLVRDKEIKLKTIAKRLKIKPSYLSHFLRLNRIPIIITDGYYAKLLSLSHLFNLSRIKNQDKMVKAYEQVLTKNLSVKKTDNLVRDIIYQLKPLGTKLSLAEKKKFLEKIKKINPFLKIKIIETRIRGRLFIEIKGNQKTTTPLLKNILARLVKNL